MLDAPRETWMPSSWRGFPARQMPSYPEVAALERVEQALGAAEAVARPEDSQRLREAMTAVAAGEAFVLQGGDCAESFADDVAENVAGMAALFEQMAAILRDSIGVPVVEVARLAGQFAKPRTTPTEWRGDVALPAYRGDIINGPAFDAAARAPDPERMLAAHRQALETARLLAGHSRDPIYTSHEALLLPYEQALTRWVDGRWWATSGHMLWVGDRTRQIGGAHSEYLRGIENVVGVKCGPTLGADELVELAERLEPMNRPGRLVLIGRFGAQHIRDVLPGLMRATRSAGLNAVWMSDPMHGNTARSGGRKVRRIDDVLAETADFFTIARSEGVHAGGIHLEMTPADVTECLGGRGPVSIGDMDRNYTSACDPRLNRNQAIDMAHAIARLGATAVAQP